MNEKKRIIEKALVVSCAKNGYVSIKSIMRKTGWTRQKALAFGKALVEDGVFGKAVYSLWLKGVKGYYLYKIPHDN